MVIFHSYVDITRGYPFLLWSSPVIQGAAERPSGKHVRAGRHVIHVSAWQRIPPVIPLIKFNHRYANTMELSIQVNQRTALYTHCLLYTIIIYIYTYIYIYYVCVWVGVYVLYIIYISSPSLSLSVRIIYLDICSVESNRIRCFQAEAEAAQEAALQAAQIIQQHQEGPIFNVGISLENVGKCGKMWENERNQRGMY